MSLFRIITHQQNRLIMKTVKQILSFLFVLMVIVCLSSCEGAQYKKIDGQICWTYRTFSFGEIVRPIDADTITFTDLENHYGKDKSKAFWEDSLMTGVDVPSFKSVKLNYAVDKNHAYYKVDVIPGADPASFEVNNENLSEDDKDYYWQQNPFHVNDKDRFKLFYIYGAEATWGRDSKYGYYIEYNGNIIKFPISNHKDFEPLKYKDKDGDKLESDYATDGVNVYFKGKVVKGIDMATFKVTDNDWAVDKRTRYFRELATDSVPK